MTYLIALTSFSVLAQEMRKDFTRAWGLFVNGDFAEAEEIVDLHLRDLSDDMHVRANYLYLKSHLQARRHQTQEAVDGFIQARTIYEDLDSARGVYTVNLGLAKVYMDDGSFAEAQGYLENNLQIGEDLKQPLGHPNELLAKLAFLQNNFNQALIYSERAYTAYDAVGDLNGKANALVQQGLLLMLTGNLSSGYLQTLRAQDMIVRGGDQNKHVYSLVNLVLYHRCNGLATDSLVGIIQERIDQDADEDLQELLLFVQNYSCDEINRLGEMDPPPPPPPPL